MNHSDNVQAAATLSVPEHDLGISSEPFEVTAELVATNLNFGGGQLPDEMMSTVERIWLDTDFTWPTTLAVTRIMLSVEPSPDTEPPQEVWSRVSILGTGWASDRPVSLTWNNAFGFPGASIALPAAQPNDNGFFGIDVVMKTTPRRHSDFVWEHNNQLVLVAQQKDEAGQIEHSAAQRAIPPHVIWQWAR
ncbi:hypothetical protein ABIB15_001017 [Marisediminicola sp. UYEF4]|uniref:hypothetical protein n=1 Tax=Marisediminicola sp. UYEF4 TaxID=1756384 RepID=UPI00339A3660